MSRSIKLTVEYDGAELCGWQRQKNGPTVQQHLEEAVEEMVGRPTLVVGASRTDAGVHALGQVASFSTTTTIPLHGFRRGLNGILPPSIAIVDAAEAAPGFHPRFSARGKRYRYTILTRRDRSPLLATRSWHRFGTLDVAAMRYGASQLLGEHDFSAFRAAGCSAIHAVRDVTAIDVHEGHDIIEIEVRGNAFLRNMVRILVGTLLEVGSGKLAASEVGAILASRDRTRAGITAPAGGLCLVEVFYQGGARAAVAPIDEG